MAEFDKEQWRDQASSDMALSYAAHMVERVLDSDDIVESMSQLVLSATRVDELMEFAGDGDDPIQSGVKLAITKLFEAGLQVDSFPEEGLIDRAMRISLSTSARLESSKAARGEPIEMLYSPADGGIG